MSSKLYMDNFGGSCLYRHKNVQSSAKRIEEVDPAATKDKSKIPWGKIRFNEDRDARKNGYHAVKLLIEKLYEKSNIMKPMNFAKLDEVLLKERI